VTVRLRVLAIASAVSFAIAASPRAARAQDTSRSAAAQELFDEALKLMDAKKYAEACPKLARSQELAPSGGTLLNLGDCYEKNGQTASAWLAFKDAANRAARAGLKLAEGTANARAERLEPKLTRLRVSVASGAAVSGLEVKRDTTTLKAAELGLDEPVDPGVHTIVASAPGRKGWSREITITPGAPNVEVSVPALEELPAAPPPPPPPRDDADASQIGATQRLAGMAVAGGGLVIAGVGAVFGFKAISTNNDALEHCHDVSGTSHCDPTGLSLTDDAKSQALVSTILVGVGVAAIAGGAALYLLAPRGTPARGLRAVPIVGRSSGGIGLVSAW
jgi:hypothetical protein